MKWREGNKPGGGGRAKGDGVIGGSAGEGAGFVVVRVAISAWARVLENLRVGRWLARVGRAVRAAAAVLRRVEGLAGALARDALSPVRAHHLQLRRTRVVEVPDAPRGGALLAGASLRHHQHRHVVPVHKAYVEEIKASGTVEGEFRQCSGWSGAASGAFELAGATVAGDAGELACGVFGAECSAPETTSPGRRCGDCGGRTGL